MRKYLPAKIQIKAAGGIRTRAFADELIAAGANRIGTSVGVELLGHKSED
jgi:deoxyribose-phosphate aldolase